MLVNHTGQRVLSIFSGAEAVQYLSVPSAAMLNVVPPAYAPPRYVVPYSVPSMSTKLAAGSTPSEPLPKLCSTFSFRPS